MGQQGTLTLSEIESTLHELLAVQERSSWDVAELVTRARPHFPDCNAWLRWARSSFRFSRRHVFTLAACISFRNNILRVRRAALTAILNDLPFRMIDVVSSLSPEQFSSLCASVDVHGLTRDELRDAVALLLARPRKPRFVSYASLPAPGRLTDGLEDPSVVDRIDYQLERRYLLGHLQRVSAVAARLTASDLVALRDELTHSLDVDLVHLDSK